MPSARENIVEYKKWVANAGKALSILAFTEGDRYLDKIKDAKIPKEAWDILAECFLKANDTELQRLQKELVTVLTWGNLTVNQFFDKVKSLSEKVTKLDPLHLVNEKRMRKVIIRGLRHELNPLIAATRG